MIGSDKRGRGRTVDTKSVRPGGEGCLKQLPLTPSTLTAILERASKTASASYKSPRSFVLPRSSTSESLFIKHFSQTKSEGTIIPSLSTNTSVGRQYRLVERENEPEKSVLKRSLTSRSLFSPRVSSLRSEGGRKLHVSERFELPRFNPNASQLCHQPDRRENGIKMEQHSLRRSSKSELTVAHKTGQSNNKAQSSGKETPISGSLGGSKTNRDNVQIPKKMSMRSIGTKVKGLIRAKNAFRRLNKVSSLKDQTIYEPDEDSFVIKEMPKEPRFASMLSAEAQYATMKGYEDIVYDKLTVSYPECRPTLRRVNTPLTGVEVKNGDFRKSLPIREENSNECENDGSIDTGLSSGLESAIGHAPMLRKNSESQLSTISAPAGDVKTTRRNNKRSQSMCNLVPEDKQLVMTYRYQSVMDILDTLRLKDGINTLSPRLKRSSNAKTPVREFSSWSMVWKKEFEAKTAKASSRV